MYLENLSWLVGLLFVSWHFARALSMLYALAESDTDSPT
jgi:hypothetical protein